MQSIKLFIQKTILIEIYKCLNNIGAAYLAKLFNLGKITPGPTVWIFSYLGSIKQLMDCIPFVTMALNFG